jgi:hypothetical protein
MAGMMVGPSPPIPPTSAPGGACGTTAVTVQVGDSVRPMDIEEFYEADDRRRASAEIELGTEWSDANSVHYELNYVVDTGELYVMQEAPAHEREDPFGGIHIVPDATYGNKLLVRVVAHIDTVDNVHKILDGWPAAMQGDGGVEWLAARLRAAGVAVGPGDPVEN